MLDKMLVDKILEKDELIKGMKENEDSAIKIMKMYEDYKLRVDKAIEILENIYMLKDVSITNNACNEIDKAINILKGSDK